MKNINLTGIFSSIVTGFKKYNLTIFIVVLVSGLAIAVLMLNEILTESTDTSNYTTTLDSTTFDADTIDRVEQLELSTSNDGAVTLPSGRINPFAE